MENGCVRQLESQYRRGRVIPEPADEDAAKPLGRCLQRHVLSGRTGFDVHIARTASAIRRLLRKIPGGRNEICTEGHDCGCLTDPGLLVEGAFLQLGPDIALADKGQGTTARLCREQPGSMSLHGPGSDEQAQRAQCVCGWHGPVTEFVGHALSRPK